MPVLEDTIIEDLKSKAETIAADLVQELGADLQESLSVPSGPGDRSEPGDPPGYDTGGYFNSIESSIFTVGDSVELCVFTDAMLGWWLEKGTTRMEPRPHFQPCYDRQKPNIIERIAEVVS